VFDRDTEQTEKFVEWSERVRLDIETEDPEFGVRFFNGASLNNRFFAVFSGDFNFIGLSLLLVFLYMWFHLRSLWLTIHSMLHIIISFPITLVVYRGIF